MNSTPSDQALAYWKSLGKTPKLPAPVRPRSSSIEEELDRLRQDYLEFPEKRWHIEQRANALKGYRLKHPLQDDQWSQVAATLLGALPVE